MNILRIAIVIWSVTVLPLQAQVSEGLERLSFALGLPQIIEVLHDEGLVNGSELAENMFPGRDVDRWQSVVSEIYDIDRMSEIALQRFGEALADNDVSELTGFFESQIGVEIVALEIAARRALMDDAVDEANKANTAKLINNQNPRIDLIRQFIEANNLLEINVVGALNSNFAFYTGLVDGGAYAEPISESEILADVWEQEPEIRIDTGEWLYGFLTMAYSPLSDAELVVYIEFSKTRAGQALNAALFAGFDKLFEDISRDLGLAAARIISSEDL